MSTYQSVIYLYISEQFITWDFTFLSLPEPVGQSFVYCVKQTKRTEIIPRQFNCRLFFKIKLEPLNPWLNDSLNLECTSNKHVSHLTNCRNYSSNYF